jgi:FkbM family methyltransferase
MCASVTADGVVYDVGAHAGFFTLLASKLVGAGRVVAFEPLPPNAARLRVNLAANGRTNVDVMEAAASDARGEARSTSTSRRLEGAFQRRRARAHDHDRRRRARGRACRADQDRCGGREGAVLRGQP